MVLPDQDARRFGQVPMSHHQAWWGAPAEAGHARDLTVACSLCGIMLSTSLMVPDGGRACPDVRWYCQDAAACTDRWTARLARSAGPRSDPGPPGANPAAAV